MSASPAARTVAGDGRRLFVTASLVYAVCLNPLLANPMTWSSLDAAVSLVETGRWQVTHGALYGDMDVALAGDRPVLGPPPGLAVVLAPVYLAWRSVAGPIATREAFRALHVVATLAQDPDQGPEHQHVGRRGDVDPDPQSRSTTRNRTATICVSA